MELLCQCNNNRRKRTKKVDPRWYWNERFKKIETVRSIDPRYIYPTITTTTYLWPTRTLVGAIVDGFGVAVAVAWNSCNVNRISSTHSIKVETVFAAASVVVLVEVAVVLSGGGCCCLFFWVWYDWPWPRKSIKIPPWHRSSCRRSCRANVFKFRPCPNKPCKNNSV